MLRVFNSEFADGLFDLLLGFSIEGKDTADHDEEDYAHGSDVSVGAYCVDFMSEGFWR